MFQGFKKAIPYECAWNLRLSRPSVRCALYLAKWLVILKLISHSSQKCEPMWFPSGSIFISSSIAAFSLTKKDCSRILMDFRSSSFNFFTPYNGSDYQKMLTNLAKKYKKLLHIILKWIFLKMKLRLLSFIILQLNYCIYLRGR